MTTLGLGVGWRPELALTLSRRSDLGFVELIAEDFFTGPVPESVEQLRRRGVRVIPHGISLSVGGAALPERKRIDGLAKLARRVSAPLVSEHLAFVRGGGLEVGHLMPVARTSASLEVVVANLRHVQKALPVPLAIENISAHFDWPSAMMDEPAFLREVLVRADVRLLLDVANVHANAVNLGLDPLAYLDALPLDRLVYVHIAGGVERDGVYHDTHTRPTSSAALALLEELAARVEVPGVMLERDDDFPPPDELNAELDAIKAAVARGDARRRAVHVAS